MSADNYIRVAKTSDGRYGVWDNRSASAYYADEGHTVESLQKDKDYEAEFGSPRYVVDDEWIVAPHPPDATFNSADAAVKHAHRLDHDGYYEYGVSIAEDVMSEWATS